MTPDGFNPLELPADCGVMILPGLPLLPKSMVPLYIFEPRYRKMLAASLAGDRMFAIAAWEPGDGPAIGGLGIVRACVGNPDGTSQLVLQGIARVRFDQWIDGSYPRASISHVPEMEFSRPLSLELMEEILSCIDSMAGGSEDATREILTLQSRALAATTEPSEFSDFAAATFVADAGIRMALLEENNATRRLEILAAWLNRQLADPLPPGAQAGGQ